MNRIGFLRGAPLGVRGLLITGVVLLMATFAVIVIAAGGVLLDRQTAYEQQMTEELLTSIRAELQAGYAQLEKHLRDEEQVFREVHGSARREIRETGIEAADIDAMAERLSEDLGYPVHLYVINPEHQIIRTTFAPDQGLDFSLPGFEDAKGMLEAAHRVDRTLVGPPTLEVVSRQFRIYSYSPLGERGYSLELGFSPTRVDELFRGMEDRIASRDVYDGALYFLFHDQWLIPLGSRTAIEGLSKTEAYEAIPEVTAEERRRFQEAISQRGIHTPDTGEGAHYAWLNRIQLDERHNLDVLARIELHESGTAGIATVLIAVLGMVAVLMLIATLAFHQVARRVFVTPLRHIASAVANRQPIALEGPLKHVRELRVLAEHVNEGVASTEQEIEGLDRLAHTDGLTELPNRMGIDKHLAAMANNHRDRGQPMALIMVDLDHFKALNDEHGHTAGDHVLKRVAATLNENLRGSDVVGRWGGEEFVVLVADADEEQAQTIAGKLRKAIMNEAMLKQYGITASFGVSALRPHDDSLDTLFEGADHALYNAKHLGRNRVETQSVG